MTGRAGREQIVGHGLRWAAGWSWRWLLIAAAAYLVGWVVQQTWTILLPVVLALVLTTVLQPPTEVLTRRLGLPRSVASVTSLIGGIAVLVAAGLALAPSVAGQSGRLVDDSVSGLERVQEWVQDRNLVSQAQIDNGLQNLQDQLSGSAGGIASGVLTGVGAVGSGVITLVLTLVLTFFFLKDGPLFAPWLGRLAGPRAGTHLREVLGRCWSTLGGFIRVQALVSLIDAVIIGIALLIIGVPLAVPLAVLTFIAGFVPIAGAFVAGAVAVLITLVSVGTTEALVVLVVIILVQQLEGNVLTPLLQSRTMQLHPVVVLLAVTLASTLFGVVGAFLAVPAAALGAVVLRYLDQEVSERAGDDAVASPPAADDAAPSPRP